MRHLGRITQIWLVVLAVGLAAVVRMTQSSTLFTHSAPAAEQHVATTTARAMNAAPSVTLRAGRFPLYFEANQGQSDSQVKFLSRGSEYTVFLTPTEAVLTFSQKNPCQKHWTKGKNFDSSPGGLGAGLTLRLQLVGANPTPVIAGIEELPGKSHYFVGNDPRKWRTNISTYAKVRYQAVYPGIDLLYYGTQRSLEYDFVIAPGADPRVIRLAFEGAVGPFGHVPLHIDTTGDLVLQTDDGEIRFHQPRIYQDLNGVKQAIRGRYVLVYDETPASRLQSQDARLPQVGFEIAAYDPSKPLIIDPVIVYSTYLGGSGFDEGRSITVDAAGNAYVTGSTFSPDFPLHTPLQQAAENCDSHTSSDIFIAKLDPAGSALVYATYLGGSGDDNSASIALDASGDVYVTGTTFSRDFPATIGVFQPVCSRDTFDVCSDAFVVKLSPDGSSLIYSTYLGGGGYDSSGGIALDAVGNAYVTGSTVSSGSDFPTTAGAFQPFCHLAPSAPACRDAFVVKLSATGSTLIYSTYLGGSDQTASSGSDVGTGIAVDTAGNAYVTGTTFSPDFPTANPFQPAPGGVANVFVTKLNSSGSALIYSTYLGGSGYNRGGAIAVDGAGNAYVAADLASWIYAPAAVPSQMVSDCRSCAAIVKLNSAGSALVYSTSLGGSIGQGNSLAIDSLGNAYVTGALASDSLCAEGDSSGTSPARCARAFIAKLNTNGTQLVYLTDLGGSSFEQGRGIAVDAAGNVYVTGATSSSTFLTVNPLQPSYNGSGDAFVAKFADTSHGMRTYVESPENGPVSGIAVIRGWGFATQVGMHIQRVELLLDGRRARDIPGILLGDIPCCSERKDVQTAFPQFPPDNTLHSGWGMTFNWSLLSAGAHTVQVLITSTTGETFLTEARTITVVKPGDAEFLDLFALSHAKTGLIGEELAVEGVVVRDSLTQRQKRINSRFRWSPSAQSLGMVQAETIVELSSSGFTLSPSLASPAEQREEEEGRRADAQVISQVRAFFESPEEQQTVSGVTVIRGWAFPAEAQDSISRVHLLIDGVSSGTAPCCSGRGDVAAVFPQNANALTSGWGMTFNYGELLPGDHTLSVLIESQNGAMQTLARTIRAVRLGGFAFVDQFHLSGATAHIDGEEIVLSGVVVRDKVSQQTKTIEVRLRWLQHAQALEIMASSPSQPAS